MKVMIVDNSIDSKVQLEEVLRSEGITDLIFICSTIDGFEQSGLPQDVNRLAQVELILIEATMSGIDGFELYRRIKTNEQLREVPIILMSDKMEGQESELNFFAGGLGYITKPFHKSAFVAMVRSALQCKNEIDLRKTREQKLQKDLSLAKQVQQSVLSRSIYTEKIEIDASYIPSEELSGDMFYWCEIDQDRYGVLILDVIGHGVAASLISMSIRSLLPGMISRLADPNSVIYELNRHMCNLFADNTSSTVHYLTAIYLVIDTRRNEIEYINAGHPPALLLEEHNNVISLDRNSIPIGLKRNKKMKKNKISYKNPLKLILYTDGLIEVPEASVSAGIEELKELMRNNKHLDNQSFIQLMISKRKQKSILTDDICVISITVNE